MEKVIIEFLERNNINLENEVVCVGISTGVDSTVLLSLLMNLKEKLNIYYDIYP